MERVMRLASQRVVVIFSTSSCCMCHTIKRLFCELGVNRDIYELDEEPMGREMEKAIAKMIGGNLVGSTDKVMSLHLSGKLVPLIRSGGGLWL